MGFRLLIVHKSNDFTSSRHACRHCTLDWGGSDMVLLSWHRTICINQRMYCSVQERRQMERKIFSGQRSKMRGIETEKKWNKSGNQKWKQGQVLPSCFTSCLCVYACLCDHICVSVRAQMWICWIPSQCCISIGALPHTRAFSLVKVKDKEPCTISSAQPTAHFFLTHFCCSVSFSFPPSTPKDPLVLIRQFLFSSWIQ